MWIEADVGSCWWWSGGHSANGVDSITTENLTPLFFLDYSAKYPFRPLSSLADDALVKLIGIKIPAVILGTAATAERCGTRPS